MFAQALHDYKTSTLLVHMIINGKGCLTGCGLHGCSLVSFLFEQVNPMLLFVPKYNIFALVPSLSCLFVCLGISQLSSGEV